MKRYKPKRRFKKKKSIFKNRIFRNFILISVLICLSYYFLFFSEIFKIKEIKISASEIVLKKEIGNFLRKELGNNFFLVNSQNLENEILNRYPKLKKANLEKEFPASLILIIEKRKPVGILCFKEESNCFLIDKQGVIFESSTSKYSEDLVVIFLEKETKNLGEEVISQENLNQILKIQRNLEKNLQIDIEKFILKEDKRLDVKIEEGWEIYFDLSNNIDFVLTKLRLLLEKEIPPVKRENLEYIDLRFSKVYYK